MKCLVQFAVPLLLVFGSTPDAVADFSIRPVPVSADRMVQHSRNVTDPTATATSALNPAPRPESVRPPLELVDISPDRAKVVRRVVGLFERAGLQLPRLVVRRGEADECESRLGFHRRHETWSEIVLCSSVGFERHVVVHELAHAWAAFELGETRQAAFQRLRGWEYWNDHRRAAWEDNGTEQAAEVIAWGIYDRTAPVRFDHRGCVDLADSFRALTGLDPVHGLATSCAPAAERVYS